jgi:hypothetical protein
MKIQRPLCIFLFLLIISHVVESCSCFYKKRKTIAKNHTENSEIVELTFENLSEYYVEVIKTQNRSFSKKLEETIGNCPFNSICSEYKFLNNKDTHFMDVRFNCDTFASATFFHTTTTTNQDKKCTMKNIISSMKTDSISALPTTKITSFVDNLIQEKMENKMCLVYLKRGHNYHVMNIEVRKNGFYIHNSWQDGFSNSWFSGLTNETEFDLTLKLKNILHEYREKYGLQKCLNRKDLENCMKDMRHIFNAVEAADPHKKEKIMSFESICKELNEHFKFLTD